MAPLPRPSSVRAAAKRISSTRAATSSSSTPTANPPRRQRPFSTTMAARSGDKMEYDPPSGWLFGVRPGEKYEREGWEIPFYTLFCGSLVGAGVLMAFKPDTSIQTWALEEARRRLEAEGILEDPEKKP